MRAFSYRYFLALCLGACAASDDGDAAGAQLMCPQSMHMEPTGFEHDCASLDGDEAVSCCVESEGTGLADIDSSYVENVLAPQLEAQGIEVAEVISHGAALCVSDTLGLYEGLVGRGADLSVRQDGTVFWQVKSWQTSTCRSKATGELGTLGGCGLALDAMTGAYAFEATVYASVTCIEE